MIRRLLALPSIALALLVPVAAWSQPFPAKSVRIIVPYPVGGGIDVLGRVLADRLQPQWGQSIVVENQPGSSTISATERAAKSPADGTTILLTTDSTFSINPHLFAKLPYDLQRDFAPVTLIVLLEQLLLAQPALPANSVAELVALARAKPGSLNYGSYGSGSQPHLAGEILKARSGVDIAHIPYKGLPLAVGALLGGEIQLTFAGVASSRGHIQAGKLKALAIGGSKRSALLPNVPTFAEQGYPEVETHAWFGLFVPAGTPRETVQRIHRDVKALFDDAAFREREVVQKGYDLVLNTPDEFAAYIRADSANRARAVKISGARAE